MPRKRKKATIHDVAKAAGVSVATVSRAINNSSNIRPDTLDKVTGAIRALGYEVLARSGDDGHTKLILLVVPDLENPFYSMIIKGALSTAHRHEYEIFIWQCEVRDFTVEELLNIYYSFNVSGVILSIPTNPAIVQAVDASIPVVQCCEYSTETIPYVSIDDYQASRMAVEFLINRGRKKISFINSSPIYKFARERYRGYVDAMTAAGLEINPKFVLNMNEANYEPVISAVSQMVLSENRPDALFAVSDTFAAAALKAARRNGLKLPDDLYIIGFDNTPISRLCDPALTTINQPQFQLGSLASEMLLERMHNHHQHRIINFATLDAELIVRESTP